MDAREVVAICLLVATVAGGVGYRYGNDTAYATQASESARLSVAETILETTRDQRQMCRLFLEEVFSVTLASGE